MSKKVISRREFIKDAAIAGAAVAATGVLGATPAVAAPPIPDKWDAEADVVIIGYGGAGATAAIAATDAKTKVLVLEKAPFGGGNTSVCVGAMLLPFPEDIEDAIKYYKSLAFGTEPDDEVVKTFAQWMTTLPDRLKKMGATINMLMKYAPAFPTLMPNKKQLGFFGIAAGQGEGMGEAMFKFMDKQVNDRKIQVMFETPATNLIQDPVSKEILGVKAKTKDNKVLNIKAGRGVVMSIGGYENNGWMQANHNYPGLFLYPWGTPYNTGDGFKMIAEIGAALWHMPSLEWGSLCFVPPSKKYGVAFSVKTSPPPGGFVYVNKYGKRFMAETFSIIHRKDPLAIVDFSHENAEYTNLPAYMVFDEAYRTKGALWTPTAALGFVCTWSVTKKLYTWSADNKAEVDSGWILKADTIADLAKKANVDAAGLQATVDQFNKFADAKKDTEFNRTPENLGPISTPPYYLIELAIGAVNTQGGPQHNAKCQVIGVDGNPIARLYSAGEFGSFFGHLYQGGNNFPEALASGFAAGEQVAALKPWS